MATDGTQWVLVGGNAQVCLDAVAAEGVAAGQHTPDLCDALRAAGANGLLADQACRILNLNRSKLSVGQGRGVLLLFDVGPAEYCSPHGEEGGKADGCEGDESREGGRDQNGEPESDGE
jgi:hypothetical protein